MQVAWMRALRVRAGLTQAQLATGMKTSAQQVYQYETGRALMGGGPCQRFCDAASVPPAAREVLAKLCGGVDICADLAREYAEECESYGVSGLPMSESELAGSVSDVGTPGEP